jgi:hypothetical protein
MGSPADTNACAYSYARACDYDYACNYAKTDTVTTNPHRELTLFATGGGRSNRHH